MQKNRRSFLYNVTKRSLTANTELNLQSLTMPFAYMSQPPLAVLIVSNTFNITWTVFFLTFNTVCERGHVHTCTYERMDKHVTEFTVYCENNKMHAKSFQSIYSVALTVAIAIQCILFMCNDIMSFRWMCTMYNVHNNERLNMKSNVF